MKTMIAITILILSTFSFLRSEEAKTYKVDIDSKGVKIFYNKKPANPDFKIELNRIGMITRDYLDSLEAVKFKIFDFDCDKDGNIIILDYNRMWKFTTSGRYLNKWSRKGYGPGEFINPSHFYMLNDIAHVMNSSKIVRFDSNGKFINDIFVKDYSDYPYEIFYADNSFLLGSKSIFDTETFHKKDRILKYNSSDLKVTKTLFEREYKKKGSMFSLDNWFIFAGDEKVFFIVDNSYDDYKIDCFDSKTGKMKYKIRKNHIRVKNNEVVKDHYGIGPDGKKLKIQTGTSKFKEAINGIFYDKYDRLWVNPNSWDLDNEDEECMYFDIFKDGVFLNRVKLDLISESIFGIKMSGNKLIEIRKTGEVNFYEFK